MERAFIQIVLNFLSNARDALIQNKINKGTIVLTTLYDEKKLYMSIEDNAGGIPENIIGQIFKPYFSTKGKNGSGIGLHMVYTIVNKHMNGEVKVENINKGVKFTVIVPL